MATLIESFPGECGTETRVYELSDGRYSVAVHDLDADRGQAFRIFPATGLDAALRLAAETAAGSTEGVLTPSSV